MNTNRGSPALGLMVVSSPVRATGGYLGQLAALLFILVPPYVGCAEPAPVVPEVERVFAAVESRFASVTGMAYTVERTVQGVRHAATEKWTFRYVAPDRIRVDCLAPDERTLILNGAVMHEYVPAARRALKTDMSRLSAADRQARVARILARVAVDGIRIGNATEMARRATRMDADSGNPGVCVIQGDGPRYAVGIDTNRQVLVTTDLFDGEGRLALSTRAADFTEVAPSFWYPKTVCVRAATERGIVESVCRISDIRVNTPISDAAFVFSVPPYVTVDERRP